MKSRGTDENPENAKHDKGYAKTQNNMQWIEDFIEKLKHKTLFNSETYREKLTTVTLDPPFIIWLSDAAVTEQIKGKEQSLEGPIKFSNKFTDR